MTTLESVTRIQIPMYACLLRRLRLKVGVHLFWGLGFSVQDPGN